VFESEKRICEKFILESEKRICDEFAALIQPFQVRIAALERSYNRQTLSSISRESTHVDMEADFYSSEEEAGSDPLDTSPTDSRYSAWSFESLPKPFADPQGSKTFGKPASPKMAEQTERNAPLHSAISATGFSLKSRTQGNNAVQERTLKPSIFNNWRSAPSTFGHVFEPCTVGSCEDCLRPDCVAWVEGQALPVAVSTIKPGQRVLCHDNLAHGMKYAEVRDVLVQSGSAEWVTVVLEDGTHLDMTANHPTQPSANAGDRRTVRAGDLRPGDDYIMVLRAMPVLVKEVIHHSAETEDTHEEVSSKDRCFLTLKQPERHALFVAPPPGTMSGVTCISTMAVGSADAKPREGQFRLNVRNTFLDVVDPEETRAAFPRSNSVPRNFEFASGPSAKLQFRRRSREFAQSPRESSHVSVSSYCSSALSDSSDGDVNVILTPGSPIEGPLHNQSDATIALSACATQYNLRSVGGFGHAEGRCTPCLFANRQQHDGGEPCWKGVLCERCHEDHDRIVEQKKKSGRMRQKMAKRRRQAQAAEASENAAALS